MKKIRLALIFIMLVFAYSCDKNENIDFGDYKVVEPENPQDKDNRMYGINISESKFGFDASFAKAKEVNIDAIELNIPWNAIETNAGEYTDPLGGILAATSFYGNENIKVSFSIAVINTVAWEVPDYLSNVAPNSQEFISAFNNMTDWFMANVPENVSVPSISIGNEVDLVLESSDDWTQYTDFYQATAEHIRQNYPDVKVGVKTTVTGGLFGDEKDEIVAINQYSDVVMLNYYPQNAQFQVKVPEAVHDDFAEIVGIFPNEEIWLTEVGYQSGYKHCMSTETKQAHFFHEMFTAWDTHKDNIKFVMIDWLFDQSPETIAEWEDYYGNDPALVEYLSTLGLCNYDGTEKPAFKQVKKEVEVRNW